MSKIKYSTEGQVAIITLDNPPLNTFGYEQRKEIAVSLQKAEDDKNIKAIILIGSDKAFSGGADIAEFGTPKVLLQPNLRTLISLIESSSKPVIAALSGVCLGGGAEVSLGCHYRVARPDATYGQPEIKIGILPGAGGSQRLPRLVGVEKALNIILTGNPVTAADLKDSGLFDEIIEGDLLKSAVAFANKIIKQGSPLKRARDIKIKDPNAEAYLGFAKTIVKNTIKNYPAPLKCLESVENCLTKPFDEAMQIEFEMLKTLFVTPESEALRHLFFAERAASKIPDVPEDTPTRKIEKVAIIGAGTMGGGIAMSFLNVGIPVTVLEATQEALDKGIETVTRNYMGALQRGKVTMEELTHIQSIVKPTLNFDDLKDADLIIEAVFEDMKVKEGVFKKLDEVAKPGAILATNTSTLDLNKIASFTKRPQDVIGMHFFSPANIMKLLEIVRGEKTAKDVLATVMALSKRIKKIGVVSGVCDGFIGNRMLLKYLPECVKLVEEGATPVQVDKALENWGMAMGPFRMIDLSGLDVGMFIRSRLYAENPKMKHDIISDKLFELGRYGQKTGAGWYRYEPGVRDPLHDPVVAKVIEDARKELKITPRKISDSEIIERCIYPLINEGAKILEEGIALRASDIDIVYVYGYGFPPFRGGPMLYADTVSANEIVHKLKQFGLTPAKLLLELAETGKKFN